jgi:carbonic anhydrase/acetyltransferase-like protein (isoleucine patch superfamily)
MMLVEKDFHYPAAAAAGQRAPYNRGSVHPLRAISMILDLDDSRVDVREEVYVAHNATVVGSVTLEPHSSVWFNAVIRGDNDRIVVGERSNVQDGAVLHTDRGMDLVIGRDVTVGHMVMLHGCSIGDGTLVGIKSVVMNRARIGRHCLIGACSLVTEGKEIPDRSLVMGVPGKVVRTLTDAEVAFLMESADNYVRKNFRYRAGLRARD